MTATTHPVNSARSTQESLRVLFFQIEAELHRSDAFRQAMSGVQNQTGSSEGMQALLKAAGREAIRLAMRQMLRHAPKAEPVPAKREKREKRSEEPATESTLLNTAASIEPEPITPLVEPQVMTRPAPPPITPFEQQRQTAIVQVGETLREARYAKGLSIEQVHSQTWVPIHQLKALEAGLVEQLPEDILCAGSFVAWATRWDLMAASFRICCRVRMRRSRSFPFLVTIAHRPHRSRLSSACSSVCWLCGFDGGRGWQFGLDYPASRFARTARKD
ncbi:MAG: helix-turn-helix domain-containing protein [Leptolyngbyaceae cyanobacterium SM1_3_5]|nr:helix-turn-helix domain-containing protein [Leptolyngbyaceae cyanobacterium SM1_3_5]